MNGGELRHFLERFASSVGLKAIPTDDLFDDVVDLPYTVGELLDLLERQDDDEPVIFTSTLGRNGVCGFLNCDPPALFLFLTTTSIQSN